MVHSVAIWNDVLEDGTAEKIKNKQVAYWWILRNGWNDEKSGADLSVSIVRAPMAFFVSYTILYFENGIP